MQKFHTFNICRKRPLMHSQSLGDITASSIFNSNTVTKSIMVNNMSQQIQLKNILQWRQSTSMPIVKVHSFKTDSFTYPKTFLVQMQQIKKPVKILSGIQLQDALYLVQQFLLGVQAISYRFQYFDFSKLFYGINQKGQCKTWISQNLTQYRTEKFLIPSQDIIINSIFKMVYTVCSNQAKLEMNKLISQISKYLQITYSKIHIKLSQFANSHKILIPNSIFMRNSSILIQKGNDHKQQILQGKKKKYSPVKINFRYQSPLPRHYAGIQQILYNRNKPALCKIQKPKPAEQHLNNQQIDCNPTLKRAVTEQSPKIQPKSKNSQKSLQLMLSSPNKLKNKMVASKDSIKQSPRVQIKDVAASFISCKNETKSQQTCTSLTINNDNLLSMPSKNIMTTSEDHNRSNIFNSFTNLTDRSQVKISSIQQISQSQNALEKNFKGYNFGGLLNLQQKSIKQSQYVDNSVFLHPLDKKQQKLLTSIILSNQDINTQNQNLQNSGWPWPYKMTNLLSTQDPQNLKQSVYCGQQKKLEAPQQIKLHLLGKLGRQINSFIPQSNQN